MSEPIFSNGVPHGELLNPGGRRLRRHRHGRLPRHGAQARRGPFRLSLWLPLTPLFLLLSPFALLLAPLWTFVPPLLPNRPGAQALRRAITAHPFRTAFALGGVLLSLSGTRITVDTADAQIRLRIF